jgi:sterol desaturase/sphingolipid hydroxylase (fatty acid hydroxylase superfamily)
MLSILIAIIFSFFFTTLFGHISHWSFHQPWSGSVHKSHMTHHLKLYPPSDYLSDKYRDAGKDSTPKFFIIAAIPVILTPILLWHFGIITGAVAITILTTQIIVGLMHNYLHDAFHIRGHWLYRVYGVRSLFAHWTAIHYLHHVDMKKNYGIFTFFWDRIFGTYINHTEDKLAK